MRKPSNLIFGIEDKPPLKVLILLAVQHCSIIAVALILPIALLRVVDIQALQAQTFISMTLVAGGIGTILQGLQKGPVGSGYFIPQNPGASYLPCTIMAIKAGGLPLVYGMTLFAGCFESLLSRILNRLRVLFPTEVTGLVVAMIGIYTIPICVEAFFGVGGTDTTASGEELIVGFATLATMIGLNVWSKGVLRLYCIIIGVVVGYALSFVFGLLTPDNLHTIREAHLFAAPHLHYTGWAFDASLVIPFCIAVICSSLKSVGDITTCQKINDADWKRPDMKSLSGGILADACGAVAAGVLGGMGQSTSSSNVGLSLATGATCRVLGLATGILMIMLAFFPKVPACLIIMPKPVLGAVLIFAVSFMIVTGIQIILSRMLDARKTFIIGISLVLGMSVDLVPDVYASMPQWLGPVCGSSLSLATVTAVSLNAIFRLGIAQRKTLVLEPGNYVPDMVFDFMHDQGSSWAARPDVIGKATGAMNEFMESASASRFARGPVTIEVAFDEYNLDVSIAYEGDMMPLPDIRPSSEALISDDDAFIQLSGYMIKQQATRIRTEEKGGYCTISINFEH